MEVQGETTSREQGQIDAQKNHHLCDGEGEGRCVSKGGGTAQKDVNPTDIKKGKSNMGRQGLRYWQKNGVRVETPGQSGLGCEGREKNGLGRGDTDFKKSEERNRAQRTAGGLGCGIRPDARSIEMLMSADKQGSAFHQVAGVWRE